MLVAEGDFFSLYPTVMVAHNISPETILPEVTESAFTVDLNYGIEGKESELVSFKKAEHQPSILS